MYSFYKLHVSIKREDKWINITPIWNSLPLLILNSCKQSRVFSRHKTKRKSTVEPVFGTLINFLGIRKVNTRGQAGAHKCMVMAACAFNLKKLLKYA